MSGKKEELKIKKLRKNLDYYLKIFKEVHGDTYDYSLSVYKGFHERIEIICKEHGVFEQLIGNHTKGKGCYKCGKIKQGKERRLTQEEFINKAKIEHNNFYKYDKTEYTTANKKVVITCPIHGEFKQTANTHLSGHGCIECGKETVAKARALGLFEFIEKSKTIHGDRYCYKKVKYTNNNTKVNIICLIHGEFLQVPSSHLSGRGCPMCDKEYRKDNPVGWNYSYWQKTAKKSKNFDYFKLYIIKCWDENEEFYKIGRTFIPLKKRFKNKKAMPYNWEVVEVFKSENARAVCEEEQQFKKCNSEFKYMPLKSFGGQYECFSDINPACLEHTKHIEEQWKKNGVDF